MTRSSLHIQEFCELALRLVVQPETFHSRFEVRKTVATTSGLGGAECRHAGVQRPDIDSGARPGSATAEQKHVEALKLVSA